MARDVSRAIPDARRLEEKRIRDVFGMIAARISWFPGNCVMMLGWLSDGSGMISRDVGITFHDSGKTFRVSGMTPHGLGMMFR